MRTLLMRTLLMRVAGLNSVVRMRRGGVARYGVAGDGAAPVGSRVDVELAHPLFRLIESLQARAGDLDAFLVRIERLGEGWWVVFELFDDRLETVEGFLERQVCDRGSVRGR